MEDERPPFVRQRWDDRILAIIVDERRPEDSIGTHVPESIPSDCLYYIDEGKSHVVILARYDEKADAPDDRWRPAGGWIDARSKDGNDERWVDIEIDGGWVYIPSSYIHAGATPSKSLAVIEEGSPSDFLDSVTTLQAIDADLTSIHPRKFAADAELTEYQRQVRPKELVQEYEVAQRMIYLVIAAIIGAIVLLGIVLLGSPSGGATTVAPAPTSQPVGDGAITQPSYLDGGDVDADAGEFDDVAVDDTLDGQEAENDE